MINPAMRDSNQLTQGGIFLRYEIFQCEDLFSFSLKPSRLLAGQEHLNQDLFLFKGRQKEGILEEYAISSQKNIL